MSLNRDEVRRTREELRQNFELSGLTEMELQADLGFTPSRLQAALALADADPSDVWLVRDYLEQAVEDAGATAIPFTVLTEEGRANAQTWFQLRPAPRHVFT